MWKTYFCELVSGFLLNLDQTTAVIFSGLSRSIIIEKMLNFALWLATTVSFKKGGVVTHNQKPIKPKQKLETLPKLEKTCVRWLLTSKKSFMKIEP